MKISKLTILSLLVAGTFSFTSCGPADEKKEDKKEAKTEKEAEDVEKEEPKEEVIEESAKENNEQYAKDWEELKTAIKNKDIPGVGKFAAHDGIDAAELVERANDHHIIQVLESYEFEHLKKEEKDGQTNYIMYAYTQQNDGPKKELEIYLVKGESGLQIQTIIAKNF